MYALAAASLVFDAKFGSVAGGDAPDANVQATNPAKYDRSLSANSGHSESASARKLST